MDDRALQIIDMLYGGLPPSPAKRTLYCLHEHVASQQSRVVPPGTRTTSFRLEIGFNVPSAQMLPLHFTLTAPGNGPTHLVIVSGDGCWRNVSDEMLVEMLHQGFGFLLFNRTEIAPDAPPTPDDLQRNAQIYKIESERTFGAVSVWAWGYAQIAAALRESAMFSKIPVAFTGHSRGGKAALLAAAISPACDFVHANNAGVLGSGSLREYGDGSETWQALAQQFPHWVGPGLRGLAQEKDAVLHFEQDELLAEIAPRPILITQAADDLWANPSGTEMIVENLRRRYKTAGFEPKVELVTRTGGHPTTAADWAALFAALQRSLKSRHI